MFVCAPYKAIDSGRDKQPSGQNVALHRKEAEEVANAPPVFNAVNKLKNNGAEGNDPKNEPCGRKSFFVHACIVARLALSC